MLKRFIVLQTKLHDGICAKRQTATIATHDLDAIKVPLTYDAQPPADIKIIPLTKRNERSAAALVGQLRKEAEELRKEKKRNTISGIHKYLDLLKGKELYPCLIDSSDTVISFPPITNSNVTKITRSTRHILVEVTSSQNLDVCKKVMEELLQLLLEMGIGQADLPPPVTAEEHGAVTAADEVSPGDDGVECVEEDSEEVVEPILTNEQVLVVQQVKIIDSLGGLRVIYPSRVDLQSSAYRVVRDYE
jgi:phenylalanyl-tRNA synthetase beta subunit